MSTPQVYVRVSVDAILDGEKLSAGSNIEPVAVAVAGAAKVDGTLSIAASTVVLVWDKDDAGVADFNFLYLACDRDLLLEFTIDNGAEVGTRLQTMKLIGTGVAGKYGMPFLLGSNIAYASNYTASFAVGTLDAIERIRVKNADADNSAKLRCILVT